MCEGSGWVLVSWEGVAVKGFLGWVEKKALNEENFLRGVGMVVELAD